MSLVTIEVEIDRGRITSVGPQSLPECGRGLLTVLPGTFQDREKSFLIDSEADGLPVIRAQGGIITSALVREIEGFVG